MIIFRTPTILDIRAAITLGVNVKETDNPIGFFGTGLKFAIAVLLREKQSITIFTPDECYRFGTKSVEIRGKPFSLVTMNEKELGFTTEFGKNWKIWMAYRELWSNTLDEGGDVLEHRLENTYNSTLIVVDGAEFTAVHRNRHEFLFLDAPDQTTPFGEVIFRPSDKIFYRGFAVADLNYRSKFTYNITQHLPLTEERTASKWDCELAVEDILDRIPEDKIAEALTDRNCLEGSMTFCHSHSDPFWDCVGRIVETNASGLNPSVYSIYQRQSKLERKDIKEFAPTAVQLSAYNRALEFVKTLGFAVDDYSVFFAERIGANVFGAAHQGRIYITRACFDAGTKQIAGTLIEEFGHLREGLSDETRAMQNWLLNRLVSVGEELKGEML